MKTVIIGSGNVAHHLAKAFTLKNIEVVQLFGRNEEQLKEISAALEIPYSTEKLEVADFYLIAVSDSAVAEVSKKISFENVLVAHTSGSLSIEVLEGNYRKASFYPLQTFSKLKELDYSKIPFFVEAENEFDLHALKNLAAAISENVMESSYEKRKYIHLTAVFACNFVNHLYARAKEIADSQQIPFQYFLPLIDETTEKIHTVNPRDAQTGPAVRDDERVLKLHQELIKSEEQLKIYKLMNESIRKMYS